MVEKTRCRTGRFGSAGGIDLRLETFAHGSHPGGVALDPHLLHLQGVLQL